MDSNRWKQIEEIFYQALDLPQKEIPAFLNNACSNDSELFLEVQSLLLQVCIMRGENQLKQPAIKQL